MNTVYLAIKNILSKPLDLLLSIILFGLGIGLINFLLLFNNQLNDQFQKNLAGIDLVIGAKGSPLQLILCGMYHIDVPTGNITVKEARAFLNPKHPLIKKSVPLSLGDSYKGYRIVGTTDEILEIYEASLSQGKLWKKDLEVVIGAEVARSTGLKIGDTFHSSHGFSEDDSHAHENTSLVVVGVLKGTGTVIDQLLLTSTSTVWSVHDHDHADYKTDSNMDILQYPDKDITSILIQFKSKTNFQSLSMQRAINDNTDMQAASPAREINRLYLMIGTGTDILRWLAIVIAIVSAISIFINLYKSMKSRRYELAIMRVLGGRRKKLLWLVLLEGIALAAIGFLVGFVLSHIGIAVAANMLESSYRYSFSPWTFIREELLLFLVSIALGIAAAIIPAYQAASTDINKTLTEK